MKINPVKSHKAIIKLTTLDNHTINIDTKSYYGFMTSWGISENGDTAIIADIPRDKFINKWNKAGLPTAGIFIKEVTEPSIEKRWPLVLTLTRKKFENIDNSGNKLIMTQLDPYTIKLATIAPNHSNKDINLSKSGTIEFDPDSGTIQGEGHIPDMIVPFMQDKIKYLMDRIITEELRKIVVNFINIYCFGMLAVPKGGMYFIDISNHRLLFNMKSIIDNYLQYSINVFPILATVENKEYLKPIVAYKCRQDFKLSTKNMCTMIDHGTLTNRTIGRYFKVIKDLLKQYKYYKHKYGISIKDIKYEAKRITTLLEQRTEENFNAE